MSVRLSKEELVTAQSTFDNKEFKELYLGGAPQELREKYAINVPLHRCTLKSRGSTVSHLTESIVFLFTDIISPSCHTKDA